VLLPMAAVMSGGYGAVGSGAPLIGDHKEANVEIIDYHPLRKRVRDDRTRVRKMLDFIKSSDGWPWLLVMGVGGAILATPIPSTVPFEGWALLAIFVATIVGAVVQPSGFGLGPLCVMAVSIACSTRCLGIQTALKDLGSKNLWLVVMAFFIARALIKSRLASRVAMNLAALAGEHNTLALAYCFIGAEIILAPMIPSVTARTGSIIFPLIVAIVEARDPDGSRRIGSFLTLCAFQASAVSSAMFVTAMAGNPIAQNFANQRFIEIQGETGAESASIELVSAFNWMLGSLVPGVLCLLLNPLLIYSLHAPRVEDEWLVARAEERRREGQRLDGRAIETLYAEAGARVSTLLFRSTLRKIITSQGDVEGKARAKADELLGEDWEESFGATTSKGADTSSGIRGGQSHRRSRRSPGSADNSDEKEESWSREEIATFLIVVGMLVAWIGEGKLPGLNIDPTTTAFLGVSMLLLTKVLEWRDIVSEVDAWSTLVWLAILSGLANALKDAGVIGFFSMNIGNVLQASGLGTATGFSALLCVNVYSHYLFASCTAHMISMYAAFLDVSLALGVQPLGAALLLGYTSNLMGGLTHYATGAAPVLFGRGYVSLGEWWRIGFVLSVSNLIIFLVIGTAWMKGLGYI